MTFRLDEKTRAKIDANPYFMDRYHGKDSIDKLLSFFGWTALVAALPILGITNPEEGYAALGIGLGILFSLIPALLFYEYTQLKQYERTGELPKTIV